MKTPTNLEECLDALKSMLSTQDQIAIIQMENGPVRLHHGLGTWMRNNWELWNPESVLATYFKTLGLWHPDDMSGVILNSFWRHLRNEPLDIEGQVKHYQEYWEKNK